MKKTTTKEKKKKKKNAWTLDYLMMKSMKKQKQYRLLTKLKYNLVCKVILCQRLDLIDVS